jgi:hypothetical protein
MECHRLGKICCKKTLINAGGAAGSFVSNGYGMKGWDGHGRPFERSVIRSWVCGDGHLCSLLRMKTSVGGHMGAFNVDDRRLKI